MASVSLPLLPAVDMANFPLPCVSGELPGWQSAEQHHWWQRRRLPLGGGSNSPSDTQQPLSLSSLMKHPIPLNLTWRRCSPTVQPRTQIRHHQPSDLNCLRVLQPYNPFSVTNHSADPPALRPQVRGEARYLFSDPNPFAAI